MSLRQLGPFASVPFRRMDDRSAQIAKYLAKATIFRHQGKPEKWARDCEVKALRQMEYSYVLRHMLDSYPRPAVLPPSTYSRYPKQPVAGQTVSSPPPQAPQEGN